MDTRTDDAHPLARTDRENAERRRQQERLQQTESLLHFASVLARMGAWDITLPDYKLIWSGELLDILGLPPDYSPTLNESMTFYHGEHRERMLRVFNECATKGTPWDEEFLFQGMGVRRWVRILGQAVRGVNGNIVRVRGALQDITDRHAAQEAVRASDERFRIVARATADIVWDWDLVADRLWWNENMETLLGYDRDQLEPGGASWTRYIHPDDVERVLTTFDQALKGTDSVWQGEYSFIRKNGTIASVLDRAFILRDEQGQAVRVAGSMVDLTSQKRDMHELARLNRILRLRSGCDQAISREEDPRELYQAICKLAVRTGDYSFCWVALTVADGQERLRVAASSGVAVLQQLMQRQWMLADSDLDWRSPAVRAATSGQPLIIDDPERSGQDDDWIRIVVGAGIRRLIYLPLKDEERVFGVICFASGAPIEGRAQDFEHLRELANALSNGVVSLRRRLERRKIEEALVSVATKVTHAAGNEFFTHLALSMANATGAKCAFVARMLPGSGRTARTVAAVVSGELTANFEYQTAGTPCEVLHSEDEWVVVDGVTGLYPASPHLAALQVRSYAGRRLDSAQGTPLGMLFLLFEGPMQDKELVTTMLRIFAGRAASEMERQDAELRIREQASLLDKAQDAMIVRDLDHKVRYWNKGAERLYGWTAEEVLGKSLLALLQLPPGEAAQADYEVRTHGKWHGEMTEFRKDGSRVVTEGQLTLVCDEDGWATAVFAIKSDITPRKAAEEEIRQLAFFDPLTGLPNRRLLTDRLSQLSSKDRQPLGWSALMFLDLDQFKVLNDTLGHEMGDQILRLVAQRLKGLVRQTDTVARLGGDEFVILLQHLHEDRTRASREVRLIGEKILMAFALPFSINGKDYFSTPSIGVALLETDEPHVGAHDLLRRADLAMYQAKAGGRNGIRFYDRGIEASLARRLGIEADLRTAIHNNAFSLHYQQQVDANGRIIGAEALLRWQRDGDGEPMPPAEFIPIAEESGLIIPLGRWVLRTAFAQLAKWGRSPQTEHLMMAINISAVQLQHKNFVDEVMCAIDEAGVNPMRLELEITETALIDNIEETIAKIAVLREEGVSFSLDDFGIGYSSLSYLRQLPIYQLKIDSSFVRDALTDPNDAIIVRTIIALGENLGLKVIAEGVETEAQRAFLESVGCLRYQGFLFGQPVSADSLPLGH